jgi:hypothetical protein
MSEAILTSLSWSYVAEAAGCDSLTFMQTFAADDVKRLHYLFVAV